MTETEQTHISVTGLMGHLEKKIKSMFTQEDSRFKEDGRGEPRLPLCKQVAKDQEKYARDPKKYMQEYLRDVVDKEIELKPLKMRARVIEQAVLKHKVSIGEALSKYDRFMAIRRRQRQIQLKHEGCPNWKTKEFTLDDLAELNREYLEVVDQMHRYLSKVTKKINTTETVRMMLEEEKMVDDRKSSRQLDAELAQEGREEQMKFSQAVNPLNFFYKKEVRRALEAKDAEKASSQLQVPGIKDQASIITQEQQQRECLDQSLTLVASANVQKIVQAMSDLPYNYKAEFRLRRIFIDQEGRKKERQENDDDRRSKFRESRALVAQEREKQRQEIIRALRQQGSIETPEEGAVGKKTGLQQMQALVKKQAPVLRVLSNFRRATEAEDADYLRLFDQIIVQGYKRDQPSVEEQPRSKSKLHLILEQAEVRTGSISTHSIREEGSSSVDDEEIVDTVDEDTLGHRQLYKRAGFVATSEQLPARSAQYKQNQSRLEIVDNAKEYLRIELTKIWQARSHRSGHGSSQELVAVTGKSYHNYRFGELMKDHVINESINSVLKRGENKLLERKPVGKAAQAKQRSTCPHLISKEQVILNHHRECTEKGVVPLTLIFNKIDNNALALHGYKLGMQAQAMQSALANSQNRLQFVKKLLLDDCGLGDLGFSQILNGVIEQDFLESISYSNDELGPLSLAQLQKLRSMELSERTSRVISELCFQNLKIAHLETKVGLLDFIVDNSNLKKVKFAEMNLSHFKVFSLLL